MKKNRFFLLLTLILSFVLALSLGVVTVFANGDEQGEQGNANPYSLEYGDLFTTGGEIANQNGIRVDLKVDTETHKQADYNYFFKIGADITFDFTIGEDADENGVNDVMEIKDQNGDAYTFTENEKVKLFYLNFYSDTSANDYIYFSTDGAKLFVSINDFDLNNAASFFELASANVSLSFINGQVYVNGSAMGKSNLTKSYAKFQIKAYQPTVMTITNISGIDFTGEVDKTTSTPVIVVEEGFLTREYAIIGWEYSLDYVAFDTLSNTEQTVTYQRIILNDQQDEIGREEVVTNASSDTIEFKNVGYYEVKITATNKGDIPSEPLTYYYTVVYSSDNDSVYYDLEDKEEEIAEIEAQIEKKIKPADLDTYIAIGDRFTAPSVSSILKSKYFDYDNIKKTLYYANSETSLTTGFTSTSASFSDDLGFEIKANEHAYFILGVDEFNNGLFYDSAELKVYKLDQDGGKIYYEQEEDGWYFQNQMIVPIFRFNIENNAAPKITVDTQTIGILGQTYKVNTININASNTTSTTYTLYFMSEANATEYKNKNGYEFNKESKMVVDGEKVLVFKTDKEYIAELQRLLDAGKIVQIEEGGSEKWDATNLTFTPKAKGNYYVMCEVLANNANSDTALTYAIKVSKSMKNVTLSNDPVKFFKNNKTAFIYLGISVLSFIGILLVLFIKPKKKVTEPTDEI